MRDWHCLVLSGGEVIGVSLGEPVGVAPVGVVCGVVRAGSGIREVGVALGDEVGDAVSLAVGDGD